MLTNLARQVRTPLSMSWTQGHSGVPGAEETWLSVRMRSSGAKS